MIGIVRRTELGDANPLEDGIRVLVPSGHSVTPESAFDARARSLEDVDKNESRFFTDDHFGGFHDYGQFPMTTNPV